MYIGKLAWMLVFYHVNFPGVEQIRDSVMQDHSHYIKQHIALHHTYHNSHGSIHPCDADKWEPSMRYDQVAVVGCGSFLTPAPRHNKGMNAYQLWSFFALEGTDELTLPGSHWVVVEGSDPIPLARPLAGYNSTTHFTTQNIYDSLVVFGPKDCRNQAIDAELLEPVNRANP